MRALLFANEADARALNDRINAAMGLPRCDFAAGLVTHCGPNGPCDCDADKPEGDCPYATRSHCPVMQVGPAVSADGGATMLDPATWYVGIDDVALELLEDDERAQLVTLR